MLRAWKNKAHAQFLRPCLRVLSSQTLHHHTSASTSTSTSTSSSVENENSTDFSQGNNDYDVVIVGGGMVGAAVGCGLATLPLTKALKVAIVDSNPNLQNIKKDCVPDARVSAITPSTVSFFKDIGAWHYVQQYRHVPFDKMQVWDYTGWGYTYYDAKDVGKSILGYVVENRVLHNALLSRLQDTRFADILSPVQVQSVSVKSNRSSSFQSKNTTDCIASQRLAKVELSDGRCLHTRLVVGADGGRSKVRSMLGLQTTGWEYEQHALVCTVKVETETMTAWQRFLPTGPLALLPMGDKFCNIVWSTTPDEALKLKKMTSDDFVLSANNALRYKYGTYPQSHISEIVGSLKWLSGSLTPSVSGSFQAPPAVVDVVSQRISFPLSLLHAREYVTNRGVLVGDAAHTVHPLAGQGVNLGFGDAAALARNLKNGLSTGFDIGELQLLKRYEWERKQVNLPMMAMLDAFQKIFAADILPVNLIRAAAFNGVQVLGPLKRQILAYAMGEENQFLPMVDFGAIYSS